jgi:hypothetical protein
VATAPQRLAELDKDRIANEASLSLLEELGGDHSQWKSLRETTLIRYRSEAEELRLQWEDTQHMLTEVWKKPPSFRTISHIPHLLMLIILCNIIDQNSMGNCSTSRTEC